MNHWLGFIGWVVLCQHGFAAAQPVMVTLEFPNSVAEFFDAETQQKYQAEICPAMADLCNKEYAPLWRFESGPRKDRLGELRLRLVMRNEQLELQMRLIAPTGSESKVRLSVVQKAGENGGVLRERPELLDEIKRENLAELLDDKEAVKAALRETAPICVECAAPSEDAMLAVLPIEWAVFGRLINPTFVVDGSCASGIMARIHSEIKEPATWNDPAAPFSAVKIHHTEFKSGARWDPAQNHVQELTGLVVNQVFLERDDGLAPASDGINAHVVPSPQ